MNLSSNEWLEITTSHQVSNVIEPFISPIKKFLYPRVGDTYIIRLIGSIFPYYRTYINPNYIWSSFATSNQIKQCLSGNIETILAVAQNLINKSSMLSSQYKVNLNDRIIEAIYSYSPNPILNFEMVVGTDGIVKKETLGKQETFDWNRMNFLMACMATPLYASKTFFNMWQPCIISNAYIREGTRCKNSLQPLVITKTMFSSMVQAQATNNGMVSIPKLAASNISGINAIDFFFYKENNPTLGFKSPVMLRLHKNENTLTHDELSNIVKQKLIDINAFVKINNRETIDSFGGWVYRPYKGIRDVSATLKIMQDAEDYEQSEQYQITEKEMCNLPQELSNANTFDDGPISGIEIV